MFGSKDECEVNSIQYMTVINGTLYVAAMTDGEFQDYFTQGIPATIYKMDLDSKSRSHNIMSLYDMVHCKWLQISLVPIDKVSDTH